MLKQIKNRWYFGLVLLPLIINLISSVITESRIIFNWKYTIPAILIMMLIVLGIEYYSLCKRFKELTEKPNERDKRIVKQLLSLLDLDNIQDDLFLQDSWYGYKKETIHGLINFRETAELIPNRILDKKYNNHLEELLITIKNFHSYSSLHLYSNGDLYYAPAKDSEELKELAKKSQPIMNEMTDKIQEKFIPFMDYLILKGYID